MDMCIGQTHLFYFDNDSKIELRLVNQLKDSMKTTTHRNIDYIHSYNPNVIENFNQTAQHEMLAMALVNHYIQVCEDISHGIIITAKDGVVISINTLALLMLNKNKEDVLQKSHGQIFSDFEILREEQQTYLDRMYVGEKATLYTKIYDDQEMRYLKFVSKYDPILMITVTMVYDETHQVLWEREQERQKNLIKVGEMAAQVVHEIRNPITSLKGFLQLLKEPAEDNSHNYLSIMESELNRLEWLTADILYVSKPMKEPFEYICYLDCLQEVVLLMNEYGKNFKIPVQLYAEKNKDYIAYGNKKRLIQMFMNLVKNAIEASTGEPVIIHLKNVDDNTFSVTIKDFGTGMNTTNHQKVFEKFYTTKLEGTGLGLSIVQKVVETHGLSLCVKSEKGKGTSFKITCLRQQPVYATFDKAF